MGKPGLFHLSILPGLGGFSLAAGKCGFTTIGHIESDPFAVLVLERHYGKTVFSSICGLEMPPLPFGSDDNLRIPGMESRIRPLSFDHFIDKTIPFPDIISAQVPGAFDKRCNGFSVDNFLAAINDISPTYVVIETDLQMLDSELSRVAGQLHEFGYDSEWAIVSPEAVLLPFSNPRLWFVAAKRYSYLSKKGGVLDGDIRHERVLDAVSASLARKSDALFSLPLPFETIREAGLFSRKPGRPSSLAQRRLLSLTQAVVPQIAQEIFTCIAQIQDVSIDGYRDGDDFFNSRTRRPVHHESFCFAIDPEESKQMPRSGAVFNGMVFCYPESEILNPIPADGLWYAPSIEDAFFDKKKTGAIPCLSSQYGGRVDPEFLECLLGYPSGYSTPSVGYEVPRLSLSGRRKRETFQGGTRQLSLMDIA